MERAIAWWMTLEAGANGWQSSRRLSREEKKHTQEREKKLVFGLRPQRSGAWGLYNHRVIPRIGVIGGGLQAIEKELYAAA